MILLILIMIMIYMMKYYFLFDVDVCIVKVGCFTCFGGQCTILFVLCASRYLVSRLNSIPNLSAQLPTILGTKIN